MGNTIERAKRVASATIANGGSLSGVILLEGLVLVSIQMPAAWTAADLTFDGTVDGVNYFPVFDDAAAEVKVPAAAMATLVGKVCVNASILEKLSGLYAIKLRSGVTGAVVAQGADRTFKLIGKG